MGTTPFTQEVDEYIIKRLAREEPVDEITQSVCLLTHLSWYEAREHIQSIKIEQQDRINQHQIPLMTGMAAVIFSTGLLLVGYGIYGLITTWLEGIPPDLNHYFLPVITQGIDPLVAFGSMTSDYLKLILFFIFGPPSALVFGLLMILGSLTGMKNVWAAFLERHLP